MGRRKREVVIVKICTLKFFWLFVTLPLTMPICKLISFYTSSQSFSATYVFFLNEIFTSILFDDREKQKSVSGLGIQLCITTLAVLLMYQPIGWYIRGCLLGRRRLSPKQLTSIWHYRQATHHCAWTQHCATGGDLLLGSGCSAVLLSRWTQTRTQILKRVRKWESKRKTKREIDRQIDI